MPILTPPPTVRPNSPMNREASIIAAWRLLFWLGAAFVVMGLTDVTLAWFPSAFGNPEWEFGAAAATLNGIALPMLGLYLMIASATIRTHYAQARVTSVVMLILALMLLVLAFIYATAVPIALGAVSSNPLISAGMKKAVVKSVVLLVIYFALFIAGGLSAWKVRPSTS